MDYLKLRIIRKSQKITLKKLGERVGCDPDRLSLIERGKTDTSVKRLEDICLALGVKLEIVY